MSRGMMKLSSKARLLALMLPVAFAGLAVVPGAFAQGSGGPTSGGATSGEFTVSWIVTTHGGRSRGVDWQSQIDLSSTEFRRDSVIFYESALGNFPHDGPQISDNPAYMASHLAKVRRDVAAQVPDANFSGYAVIDYEGWVASWNSRFMLDRNKQLWEAYLLRDKPQVLRGLSGAARQAQLVLTYNAAARDFFVATINECKRLRPNAKWGYYGYPLHEYYVNDRAFKDRWKAVNQELSWLYDVSDVLYPHAYSFFVTVEGRQPDRARRENAPSENEQAILENVAESVRLAAGKPVRVFVWPRYHDSTGPAAWRLVNEVNLQHMLQLPKLAGAQGIMFWDCIQSPAELVELRTLVQGRASELINGVVVRSDLAAAAVAGSSVPSGSLASGSRPGVSSGSSAGSSSGGGSASRPPAPSSAPRAAAPAPASAARPVASSAPRPATAAPAPARPALSVSAAKPGAASSKAKPAPSRTSATVTNR
jgi:hypothetical protein